MTHPGTPNEGLSAGAVERFTRYASPTPWDPPGFRLALADEHEGLLLHEPLARDRHRGHTDEVDARARVATRAGPCDGVRTGGHLTIDRPAHLTSHGVVDREGHPASLAEAEAQHRGLPERIRSRRRQRQTRRSIEVRAGIRHPR